MRPCQEREELLCLAVDGALSEDVYQELMEHLNHCNECREFYEMLMVVHHELHEIGETDAPEQLKTSVITQIIQEKKRNVPVSKHRVWYRMAALAACMVLCIALYQQLEGTQEGVNTTVTNSVTPSMGRKTMSDEASGIGAATFAAPEQQTVLRISHMPQAGSELLSDLEWEQDAEGWTMCTITSELMTKLCEILEREGIEVEIPVPPYSEYCVVMWQTT